MTYQRDEFACKCCGENKIDDAVIQLADRIALATGFKAPVNSGYRCAKRNTEAGGKENSAHLLGLAVDLGVKNGAERRKIIKAAFLLDVQRVGVANSFVHLDLDAILPQGVLWTY